MRILIIEPDRIMGRALAEAFSEAGHNVDLRRDGQEALDGVDQHEPDIIVLEPQIGKHNGVEFLYELRSHKDWLKVPVIIHTANSHVLEPEFKKSWLQLGVKELLYKPETTIARLKKVVSSVTV